MAGFSLLNGLNAVGTSTAQFAGTLGLEAQKSDLQRQSLMLADQLATTRETNVTQPFQALQEDKRLQNMRDLQTGQQTFQGGENEKQRQNAIALERMRLSQPPDTFRMLQFLDPDTFGTPGSAPSSPSSGVPSPSAAPSKSTAPPPSTDSGATWDDSAMPATTTGNTEITPARKVVADQLLRKATGQPAPGSEDYLRQDIANGVTTDPAWRDKPRAEQAAEIKKRIASASASLSPDALDILADRTIAGDTTALTGLGYGETGAANRAAALERIAQKMKAKGMTGADLAAAIAAFGGEKAGARSAGTREANVGMAVTEAQLFMPLALEASKLVSRTQFPTINSIVQAAEKGTGDENVVRLAVATNSLVNAYARAITPSGIPTEGNQTRARELLDKAWSEGQYAAAIDQLSKEMKAAKASPIQQQSEQRARISGRSAGDNAPTGDTAAQKPATPKIPSVGDVQQGYRFKGGDPASPSSWTPVQ